jgi:hypothetical protein
LVNQNKERRGYESKGFARNIEEKLVNEVQGLSHGFFYRKCLDRVLYGTGSLDDV